LKPGDVVIGAFPGAHVTKTRQTVVLSSEDYHRNRPDVVLGVVTTQTPQPLAPTDCTLLDWSQAGLHTRSYLFLVTLPQREIRLVGRRSDSDSQSVQTCFQRGFGGH
jgi:mRNA interferase MazF